MKWVQRGWIASAIAVILVVGSVLCAAEITVNISIDEVTANGNCSLREAILAANADAVVDGCTAGSEADLITLVADTYTLSLPGSGEDEGLTGDLDIAGDLTITGSTDGRTIIDGGGIDRVFHLDPSGAGGFFFTFSHLTIRNGDAGADDGGGIALSNGTATFNEVTISGNKTTGSGCGIYSSGGTLTLNNSTISNNASTCTGGGIRFSGTTGNLNNVTIANNSFGGITIDDGTVNMRNSIIADNADASGDSPDCDGTIASQGYNLIEDPTGCIVVGITAGNITGVDPILEELADNGGPTETHAIGGGSPAIDAGDPTGCKDETDASLATDQRGLPRGAPRCDIGAFEISCGNGHAEGGEECDDGNTTSGDGCDSACLTESGSGGCGLIKKFL